MKIVTILYLLLSAMNVLAQKPEQAKVDSLLTLLPQAKTDSDRVNLLINASNQSLSFSPDQSIKLAEQALDLSKKIKWNNGIILSCQTLGQTYWANEDWAKVIELIQLAIGAMDAKTPKQTAFNLYTALGAAYTYLEIYPLAMENFQKALSIINEIGNEEYINITIGNIGWVYYNMGDYRAAIRYGQKNLESSLKFDNKNDIANCYGVGGLIYTKLNLPDSAIYCFNKAIALADYMDPAFHSAALNGLGEVYIKKKEYTKALDYLLQAADVAIAHKNYRNLQDIYFNLGKTYEMLNNASAALEAYKKYNAYKDTANVAIKQHELAFAELQSETKKKDVMQQASLQRQTLIRNASIGGLLLAAILVFVLIVRFREKKKAHAAIESTLDQLKDTQHQLIEQEKLASLGQLTAGVAHEINNPINFVSANVSPLKRNFTEVKSLLESYDKLLSQTDKKISAEKLKEEFDLKANLKESEDLLNGIEEGSRRTAEIVKGLRSFSRVNEEEKSNVNVEEGIESTLVLLRNKLKHQKIEIQKSFAHLPEIEGYPGQLNQVFMNLLTNAIDAISSDGKIFISTTAENGEVKISIRDTGVGMSDAVKKKLFDPFFTTKDVGKGTGLGLSISYGIIEKHNGKIQVLSEMGKGTEFIITLPVHLN